MRRMGELESMVMDLMWNRGDDASVREVMEILHPQRPLAYTTVMTVMDNLHRKGFLLRTLHGRAYRYRASKGRSEYTAELMDELLAGSGDRSATLLRFVDRMDSQERANLKRALGSRRSAGEAQ